MLRTDQRAVCIAIDRVADIIARTMEADASPTDRMSFALMEIGQVQTRFDIGSLPSGLQAKISEIAALPHDRGSVAGNAEWNRKLLDLYFDLILATRTHFTRVCRLAGMIQGQVLPVTTAHARHSMANEGANPMMSSLQVFTG
jgi:hypothetical protein